MADLTCTLGKITPTEIVNAVNTRVEENTAITPATNTKITYDAKGLVTSGEAATTADIADSTDKRYVTDAESTVIDNTSNTNSGDNATNTQYSGLVSNIQSDLALGTPTPTAYPITNTDGTGFSIPEADTTNAGLLGSDKWDEIVANSLKETNVTTDLTQTTAAAQLTIHSSDGDDIVVAEATASIAGLMSTTHHDKLDGIDSGAEVNVIDELLDDTSPQLGGDLDCNGKTLNKSAVRQVADDSGSGTAVFDYATEDMVQYTATGNLTTLTFSNFPSGDVAGYIIDAVNWGAHTITHPAGMLFVGGASPSYTTAGTDRILVTSDKDAVLTLTVIALDIQT